MELALMAGPLLALLSAFFFALHAVFVRRAVLEVQDSSIGILIRVPLSLPILVPIVAHSDQLSNVIRFPEGAKLAHRCRCTADHDGYHADGNKLTDVSRCRRQFVKNTRHSPFAGSQLRVFYRYFIYFCQAGLKDSGATMAGVRVAYIAATVVLGFFLFNRIVVFRTITVVAGSLLLI